MLNTASTMLMLMKLMALVLIQTARLESTWPVRKNTRGVRKARSRFIAGPASATSAMSRLGWFRRWKNTGTGLAQPNRNGLPVSSMMPGRISVPSGSMWTIGLRLTRPSERAVESPSRSAASACAASCSVIARMSGMSQTESWLAVAARSCKTVPQAVMARLASASSARATSRRVAAGARRARLSPSSR